MFEEPKDIFAGVDTPPKAPVVQPPTSPSPSIAPPPTSTQVFTDAHMQASIPEQSGGRGGSGLIVIGALLLLILGGGGIGYWYYQQAQSSVLAPVLTEDTPSPSGDEAAGKGAEQPAPALPNVPTAPVAPPAPVVLDGDGDGLSDDRETTLGTSLVNNDTDGDGLGDREEVDVYGTDPLRQDTDDDTYLDGAEVSGGYNPNGPGKLLNLPTAPTL